jgi:hypothetical protein
LMKSGSKFWHTIICIFMRIVRNWTAVPRFYILSPIMWFYFISFYFISVLWTKLGLWSFLELSIILHHTVVSKRQGYIIFDTSFSHA